MTAPFRHFITTYIGTITFNSGRLITFDTGSSTSASVLKTIVHTRKIPFKDYRGSLFAIFGSRHDREGIGGHAYPFRVFNSIAYENVFVSNYGAC